MSHDRVQREIPKGQKPVESPEFWRDRMFSAIAKGGMLHQIILDDSYALWCNAQARTGAILMEHIKPKETVLDAGCGYGALLSCFEEAGKMIPPDLYCGVDISPDLIRLARERYPKHRFEVEDLRRMPEVSHQFDWCVCRSVQGMIIENIGQAAWDEMERELLRVSKRLLLIAYPEVVNGAIEVMVKQ